MKTMLEIPIEWLLAKDDGFYEGRARRDNMSNPGDKDYEC